MHAQSCYYLAPSVMVSGSSRCTDMEEFVLEKATSLLTTYDQPLLRSEDNHLQALGKPTRITNNQYIEWDDGVCYSTIQI